MPKNCRNGQSRIFSNSDYEKILRQLENPKHKLLLNVARYTGERWGAICQLKVSDVYSDAAKRLPKSHVTFRASTRKAAPDGSRQTRQVLICDRLAEILRGYQPPADGWLFPSWVKPATPMSIRNADQFLRLAIERAGIGDGYSTHSTRRTFITTLSRSGVGVPVIQNITGHRSVASLIKYIEVSDEQVSNALAVL